MMNKLSKYIYFSIILSLFTIQLHAEEIQQVFDKANELYMESQYEEALKLYQQLIDSNYVSADLYYNLGNTYYRLNDIPHAILYYEKALKLKPDDRDILHNLKLANWRTVDKIEASKNKFMNDFLQKIYLLRTPNQWAVITIVFLSVAVLCFLAFLYFNNLNIKKAGFYSSLFFTLLFLITMFTGFQSKKLHEQPTHAVIMTPTVTIFSEPHSQSSKLFNLHEGTKVMLLETYKNWQKIAIENGQTGWLKKTDVEEI